MVKKGPPLLPLKGGWGGAIVGREWDPTCLLSLQNVLRPLGAVCLSGLCVERGQQQHKDQDTDKKHRIISFFVSSFLLYKLTSNT